ncbi:spore gernimation protein GerD [Bacillus aquiflavi]|uniref:Spore gernimation protein GerD n=1 Tax=Bacillus aquiflavi TaxID=2672567 RepID=A0A6B3W532_9BACI|nr:spore germination lipoprotein GerD [Bacillus aquiflavi]MBA4538713.1 spore gernimation protein GerD [Bacillus aquiflavi]NEY83073.1 spore gernimation protein GerD [Bacillus aquiflavi]
MQLKWKVLLPLFIIIFVSGCSSNNSNSAQIDYDQTKKMVVDILKTDEGKKAFKEVMSDEKLKRELVMDQAVVSETIEKTLTSEKGNDFWKKSFEDPKFAESFAKSMKKENEKMLKDLMKDPEYRAMMVEILKDPEIEKNFTDVLKSNEYRKHLQNIMTETFDSPLFKAKIQEILLKAAENVQDTKKADEGANSEKEGQAEEGGEQ